MINRIVIIIFSLFYTSFSSANIVLEFHKLKMKSEEIMFLNKYRNNNSADVLPYYYAIEMKQATYLYNPFKKIGIFNKYKTLLELAIKKYSSNIHLRYIRLVIQEKTPSLLNYKSNINEDKLFLQSMMAKKDESDYLDYYIKLNTSL